jgi:DNA repair protein RadC
MDMKNRTIKDWNEDERPREKLKLHGEETLTDAELLAIMLGSGTRDKNVVELSREILNSVGGDLNQLARLTLHDLQTQFKGIGEAKAMHLLATLEFGRRRNATKRGEDDLIRTSKDIVRLMHPVISDMPVEEFWVILLNRKNKVIGKECVARGGVSAVLVDMRLLLKPAITRLASSIILCHNHPSGTASPSSEDRALTRRAASAVELLYMRLLDHVIITSDSEQFYSFADHGEL